jgi:peptide/nickel transport system ATP-binding protein
MADAQSAAPLLDIRNLRIEATVHPPGEEPRNVLIVDDVSLTLGRGKVLGLIGESGAGKSTIALSSLAYGRGGVRITGGKVLLDGDDILQGGITELRKLRGHKVTYVAQSAAAAFNPARTLMDQVIESSLWHNLMSREAAEARAVELFAKLNLPDPANIGRRYPHQVSGGQLQRVMTAMALCPKPDLIIFDEPTTALDVTTQVEVLAAIKEAIRDTGVAALYITHDLAVVAQVSDEIMVLRYGKRVEWSDTDTIINHPKEDYTRALVSVQRKPSENRPPVADKVLELDNVCATYSTALPDVLSNVSVSLEVGRTLAVVGESGSGKSTMARVICGLLPLKSGTMRFAGQPLSAAHSGRSRENLRELQLIYQMADVAMNPRHTVAHIIGRPIEFYFGVSGAERDRRVAELLESIELGKGFADRYPAELSGGQKQRVCIARALAAKPKMIICDEVTSALDPLVAEGILKLLSDLQRAEKVSYLFITHDIATVRSIADKIAVMHRGRVVRYGARDEVLSPPFDDYTDLLLSSVPELELGWLERTLKHRRMASGGN